MTSRTSPRTIALALALVVSLAIGMSQSLAAACNCSVEGQCASGVCCFVDNACTPTDQRCVADWSTEYERFFCSAGTTCEYTGPPCGVESETTRASSVSASELSVTALAALLGHKNVSFWMVVRAIRSCLPKGIDRMSLRQAPCRHENRYQGGGAYE
jgi:hypothetical protein